MRSLILRDHRLKVSVLILYGYKEDSRGWEKLYDEAFQNLSSSSNIVRAQGGREWRDV